MSLFCLAVAALLVASIMIGPIAQSPSYHHFADHRAAFGIPNFANVISNIPFLIIGFVGLRFVGNARRTGPWQAWMVFFVGTALVSVGSAYYHLDPGDARLIWDRLPMTIAFMGLFAALMDEDFRPGLGRWLLLPVLLVGLASVVWWRISGDLRPYIWVQAAPFLAIVLTGLLFPVKLTHRVYLLYGGGFYALAKLAELYDREFFANTAQLISGHSIKHLLASCGAVCVYLMLRDR